MKLSRIPTIELSSDFSILKRTTSSIAILESHRKCVWAKEFALKSWTKLFNGDTVTNKINKSDDKCFIV